MKVLELFKRYIEYYRHGVGLNKRDSNTIRHYVNKYFLLERYLKEQQEESITCNRFNSDVCNAFFGWLTTTREYDYNYAVRVVQICVAVLSFGVEKRYIKTNNAIYFKLRKKPPKEPPYLTSNQIRAIENYTSPSIQKQKAADLFVLQIYTGYDYGDFAEIKRSDVFIFKGRKILSKPRHKNNNRQYVILTPVLEGVLEKYNYNMRLLSNPRYNKMIKEVMKDLDINVYLKCKDGRKLFFMNKINNEGYSVPAVSRMGGHNTVRTTEGTYVNVHLELIMKELDRLGL